MANNVHEILDIIPFQQTDEQIDSLRLETQSVSPADLEDYKALVANSHHKLINYFGNYIPHAHTDNNVANRFLVTDDMSFRDFENNWLRIEGKPETSYTSGDEAVARAYPGIAGDLF